MVQKKINAVFESNYKSYADSKNKKEKREREKKKNDCFGILRFTSQFPTSFPGSFISPPPLPTHFSSPHTIWGGEMRDPGNEVARFPDNQDNIQEGLGELRLVFCIVFSFSQTSIRLFLHSASDSTMNEIRS